MAVVCPSITAYDKEEYRRQIERVSLFAARLHLDFMDGWFVPSLSPPLKTAWWPGDKLVDFHLMYRRPAEHLKTLLKLKPHMVIVHAEAQGRFSELADSLHAAGIKVGLALLQKTRAETVIPALDQIDHVLIFGGVLGHFGGHADLRMLDKAAVIKKAKPDIEIGWDGGVNDLNAATLVHGGVDMLAVGGFIQHALDPAAAYATLEALVQPL